VVPTRADHGVGVGLDSGNVGRQRLELCDDRLVRRQLGPHVGWVEVRAISGEQELGL
jgi:hypothetical protein